MKKQRGAGIRRPLVVHAAAIAERPEGGAPQSPWRRGARDGVRGGGARDQGARRRRYRGRIDALRADRSKCRAASRTNRIDSTIALVRVSQRAFGNDPATFIQTPATTPAIAFAPLLATAPADSAPSCATDLALLERTMHLDYAGYTLELRGERLTRFAAMKRALQERADRIKGDDCYFVLRDFVEWFDDPHLFVYQSTRLDTAETTRRAAVVARRNVTEASRS